MQAIKDFIHSAALVITVCFILLFMAGVAAFLGGFVLLALMVTTVYMIFFNKKPSVETEGQFDLSDLD